MCQLGVGCPNRGMNFLRCGNLPHVCKRRPAILLTERTSPHALLLPPVLRACAAPFIWALEQLCSSPKSPIVAISVWSQDDQLEEAQFVIILALLPVVLPFSTVKIRLEPSIFW